VELGQGALPESSTKLGRWLRERRVKIALSIAVVEGVLILLDQIAGWLALVIGAGILVFYFFVGRSLGSDAGRQATWIAALSQAALALVPIVLFLTTALAIFVLAVLAVVLLAALFIDRR
jgi:hypothetical protein